MVVGIALLFVSAASGLAQPAPRAPSSDAPSIQIFPPSRLYPAYTADPRSSEFGLTLVTVRRSGVAESGSPRVGLKLGGRFGLVRVRTWQFDIEAGFAGQFDMDHSLDNLGWDGTYAFLLSHPLGGGWSAQAGSKHVSSHVGDEYEERTGRRRIGYTREEIAAGVAWDLHPRWRAYAEAGWDTSPKPEIPQEHGRLQAGLEHLGGEAFGQERLRWYAAANLEAMEERDWQVDAALQVGLRVPSGDRLWRLGLAWYDGRVPLGEFFQDDESYLILGLWLTP